MKSNASDYKILPSSANAIADDDYDDDDFVAAKKDKNARDKTAHRPNGPVDIDADDVADDAELGKVDRFRVAAASNATQSSTLRVDGRGTGASRVLTSFRRRLVLPFNSNNNKGNTENCHSETSLLSSTPSPRRRRRGQQLGNFNPTPSMTSRGKVLSSSASINPTYIRGSSLTPIVGNCSTATLPSAGRNHRVSAVLINAERADDRDDDEYYYDLRDATSKSYSPASRACRLTFLFDPAGSFCYYWSLVVSLGFLYNLWVIIYRYTFDEINAATLIAWFCLDYFCDLVYALDVAMQFRTGFLEEGVLQINPTRLRIHYTNSTRFYMDCLSLLPLDFLYLSLGFKSILRSFRLVKVYKFWSFVEKTERHTNFPNVLRGLLLFHSIILIFHWNACLIYVFRHYLNYAPQYWDKSDNFHNYLNAYYLSCRTLMLIESLPKPHKGSKYGYVFIIFEQVFGLIMLATVLGHVSGIVANVSAARKHFQAQLDAVKTYMHLRKVPNHLQRKVIRWFDYWWSSKKFGNDKAVVECLPDKLKAEIAIHVHLDTLKRVEIFQNTEPGFLCELVIRLKPMLFSPGDYICRKGEVGKEMYIVNRGKLQVLADDGKLVLATLTAGSYFGEISILNMGTEGNRRTASVVSLGYSDLFCLTKKEIWEVLEDYPAARARLELIANKRLQQKAEKLLSMVASRDRFSEKTSESPGLPHLLKVASSGNCQRRRGSAPAGIYYSATPSSGNIASGLLYRCNQIISSHNKGTFLEPPAFAPSSGSCLLTTTNSQPFLSSPTKRVNSNVAVATTPLMNNANFVANSRRVSSATNASTMFDVAEEDDNDCRGSFEENNDNLEKAQLLLMTSCSSNNSPSKNDQPSLARNEFKNDALIDSPQTPSLGETFQLTLYSDTAEAFM